MEKSVDTKELKTEPEKEDKGRFRLAKQVPLRIRFRALLNEITSPKDAHDLYLSVIGYLENQDYVLSVAGKDSVLFYDSMIDSDAYLAGLINTRIDAVTGLEWNIIPASEESKDEEIATFVKDNLYNLEEFVQDLEELLGALRTGYAVSEILWKREDNRIVIDSLKSRRPDRFRFDPDYRLLIRTKTNYYIGDEAPVNKFIVHRNNTRYENPYGISVCRSIYWVWHFKHYGFQWWLVAAERNAVPTPIGKYPTHWDPDQQEDFFNYLLGFQNDNAIICEQGADVELVAPKTDPMLNKELRNACNEEMSIGILGSTHSTGTGGTGSGSYALAQEHGTVRQDILERDCRMLQATIDRQLIQPLVLFNYGVPPNGYPRFKLNYEPPADRETETTITEKAVKMGMRVDEGKAAEKMGIDLAEEGETPIVMPTPAFGGGGQVREFSKTIQLQVPESPRIIHGVKREGQRIEENLKGLERAGIDYGRPALQKVADQFMDWLDTQPSLSHAMRNFDYWQFDTSPLASNLTDSRFWSSLWGYHDLFMDRRTPTKLKRVRRGLLGIQRIDSLPIQLQETEYSPVPPEEAIEIFDKRGILTRDQFDALLNEEKREAFTAAGTTADTLRDRIKPAMMDALSEGLTLRDFKARVGELLLSPTHTETVFRTNIQSAYNSAHADAMFDPIIADLMPGVQFLAIIDDRTTEVCMRLHGQIFLKGELLRNQLLPPLHYNCRSTVVPVFVDEMGMITGDQMFDPTTMAKWPESAQALPGFGYFRPVVNAE